MLRVPWVARAQPDYRPFLGAKEFGRAARVFFENPDRLVRGNETAEEAGGRFEGVVRGVLDELEEVITIVAHGTVISLLVARHNGLDAYALWRSLGLPSFCILSAEKLRLREAVSSLKT
jgi:broad specificity phosphatase PhoE